MNSHPLFQQALALSRIGQGDARHFDAVNSAVQCLGQLANDPSIPAPLTPMPIAGKAAGPSVSVVICSINPEKFATVSADYRKVFAGHELEIIAIHDAKGLNEAYNRGLDRAQGEVVIFGHDDIRLLNADFAARMFAHLDRFDVIGVSGATRVTGPGVAWAGHPHVHGWVAHQHGDTWAASTYTLGFEPVAGAQALDGVWLAARREAAERIRFDADLPGFHFYDLDFTLRAHRAGLALGICPDLRIVHASFGSFGPAWQEASGHFQRKYPALNAPAGRFHTYGAQMATLDAIPRFYAWLAALAAAKKGR